MNKLMEFNKYLIDEEKSRATIEKYLRDVRVFIAWCENRGLEKSLVLEYKKSLCERYAPTSVNAAISSLNSYFSFISRKDCCVKMLKIQRKTFLQDNKELTKAEYERLLSASQNNSRLNLLLQTICSTGIRVSELKFITVEAAHKGIAQINNKGKLRNILLPKKLCRMLLKYAKAKRIICGNIFITKNGKPLDRSNVWSEMKKLCVKANVANEKVFPHNLRHLFARTYYSLQRDIIRLADILGHSNINTTRIYTVVNEEVHRKQIETLGFLKC